MLRFVAFVVATIVFTSSGIAVAGNSQHQAGDIYEISNRYNTEETDSDESSAQTNGHSSITERVISVSETGLELEYDIPVDPRQKGKDRIRNWQFPARVFKPLQGKARLLNQAELKKRLDQFLNTAKLSREACGRWFFTWTAGKIECDPESALQIIEQYDLKICELKEGLEYQDSFALAAGLLKPQPPKEGIITYTVQMDIDSEKIRAAKVEEDLVTAEILEEKLSREDAVGKHAASEISGTITATFEAVSNSCAHKLKTVTSSQIREEDGLVSSKTSTVTLERQKIQ
jgi:hypothetical protein